MREETVKFIYEILKKHSVKINGVDVIPVSSCIALVGEVINHEQNTLKEFVEFAKGEFIKANYCYNDTYLDTMLEMFLEERK